jgi:hypothetical protein
VQLSGWTGVAAEVTASSLCWAGEAGSSRKPLAPYFKVAGRELVGDDAVGRGAYLFIGHVLDTRPLRAVNRADNSNRSIQQACLAHALGVLFGVRGVLEWQPIDMIRQ